MIDENVPVNGAGVSTSTSLLAGLRAGEPEAWQRFVALYRPLLLHWCRRGQLQLSDAEDVAQEVFQAVSGAVERFRHAQSGGTLRGWLRMITQNKIRDHVRRAARRPGPVAGDDPLTDVAGPGGSESESNEPADPAEERIVLRQAIEMVLASFKEHNRRAFWRVVVDGQTAEDVAAELGIPVHAVYLAKSRVLRRLRDEFAGLVEENPGGTSGPDAETSGQTGGAT